MADPKLDAYIRAVVDAIAPGKAQVEDALQRIRDRLLKRQDPQPVQLLALRRYLRIGGAKLVARWPWTPVQQAANQPQIAALLLEAGTVQARFAAVMPGYSLGISPIRDLDSQVRLWCNNPKVQQAAAALSAAARNELAKPNYLNSPNDSGAKSFTQYLKTYDVRPEPTSAAPGTSDHGQMRAVDFVVIKNGKVIAGTDFDTIVPNWRATGFERALIDAAAPTRLKGPLPTPYEPWHWWLP